MSARETRSTESRVNARGTTIVGMAIVFNSETLIAGDFYEKVLPQAVDGIMKQDVRALFNHNADLILGRTKSGTLRLQKTAQGLMYEIDADTSISYVSDLVTSIGRNDITGSSFSFAVPHDGARWEQRPDGMPLRVIMKLSVLWDVSPVTYPAYTDTTAALRSLEQWRKQNGIAAPTKEANICMLTPEQQKKYREAEAAELKDAARAPRQDEYVPKPLSYYQQKLESIRDPNYPKRR